MMGAGPAHALYFASYEQVKVSKHRLPFLLDNVVIHIFSLGNISITAIVSDGSALLVL